VTEIDSGELAAVAATLGIAHPSGYPLYALVGRVATLLPWPVRTIVVMNALSALLAAGAVFMLYRTVEDLLPGRRRGWSGWPRVAGAGLAALAFAFHPALWSVATVTEVHALQMFLDAALLHAIVRSRLWGAGRFRESAWLLACYLGGLCLTNHLTSALLLPGFLLCTFLRRGSLRPRLLLAGAGLGGLGASAYLFLPIRAAQHPYLNWGAPETWNAFVRHVTGAQYRVWMFTSADALARNGREFVSDLVGGYGWPLLALAVIGSVWAVRVPRLLPGIGTMFTLALAYPLGYDIHDIATYFLAPYLLVAVPIGLGAAAVGEWMVERKRARVFAPAVLLLAAIPLITGWRSSDRSDDRWVESMARSFLATPERDSVVLSAHWDVLLSPALYLQQVEGVRADLTLLDQEFFRRSWNLPGIRRWHPELLEGLESDAGGLQTLIERFESGRPYEVAEIQAVFERVIGGILERGRQRGGAYIGQEIEPGIAPALARVPDGLLLRLEPADDPPRLGKATDWPELPDPDAPGTHLFEARRYAARMAALSGHLAFRLGDLDRARRDLDQALGWDPMNPLARQGWEAVMVAGGGGAGGGP
jgi:hypothetical protein